MIPDHLTLPVAVLGMAVLTLVAAGLFSSYQRAQAYKRRRIQALILGVRRAETLLARLGPTSLPRDVRLLLRQDIHDRYRLVARIHARYPRVQELIEHAAQRRDAEAGDAGKVLPVPDGPETLASWQAGFAELLDILARSALVTPLPAEQRERYRTQVIERQAECNFGHFMNQADKRKGEGRQNAARSQVQQLTEYLRSLSIRTERTTDLLRQAEEAYRYLLDGTAPTEDAAAG